MSNFLLRSFLFLCVLMMGACSSKPKAVNGEPTISVLPAAPVNISNQITQDSLGRSPTAAIEGKVLLDGPLPAPLSNIQLVLYKYYDENNTWREITRMNTSPDGSFTITQKLTAGSYEVRISDPRYTGSFAVTLEKSPVRNLVLQAKRK